MKSSDREDDFGQGKRLLVVDGYNVLAAEGGTGLRGIKDLDQARERLTDRLGQYQSYFGEDVALVFDAYRTAHQETEVTQSGVRVFFTDTGETADHRIERLVYELRDHYRQITVATSDFVEQQVTFGGGALRISAGELLRRLQRAQQRIRSQAESLGPQRNRVMDSVQQDVANILEKWRRQ